MSNKNLKSTGVILRKVNLNEGDRIVTLLTADRGKVHALAKGARQFKSKFCGKLEPFNHLAFTGFQGRELIYLNEVELLSTFCERTAEHGPLFYLAEVTHKLMQDDEHVDGVYELFGRRARFGATTQTRSPGIGGLFGSTFGINRVYLALAALCHLS
ncbi:DNA repair protein RecO [Candidatus Peregrinibacteria bacterium]|nr:MAG: DNA repair protein RecO [Candidatus Peregrinibacteria bacterium]